ncbi:MAG: DsbC family protein, partial [Gammaproteobacteria bacterium]|nr:DsbC family protein [Gammaproteobacteria bacterium]
NLTEARRDQARLALVDAVPRSQMLIRSPPNPRYTITVFTDVDCPFCRKLHSEIDQINALGIGVRYVFFPRTGPGTLSWHKAEAVWCAPDRMAAFTAAMTGGPLDLTRTCGATPVAREYQLGREVGVRGTPAIITSTGAYIDGFASAPELLREIQAADAGARG